MSQLQRGRRFIYYWLALQCQLVAHLPTLASQWLMHHPAKPRSILALHQGGRLKSNFQDWTLLNTLPKNIGRNGSIFILLDIRLCTESTTSILIFHGTIILTWRKLSRIAIHITWNHTKDIHIIKNRSVCDTHYLTIQPPYTSLRCCLLYTSPSPRD